MRDVTFDENAMLDQKTVVVDSTNGEQERIVKQVEFMLRTHDQISTQQESNTELQDSHLPQNEVVECNQPTTLAAGRSKRQVKPPDRYGWSDLVAYALPIAEELCVEEPISFKEAIMSPNSQKWLIAMNEEMESLHRNQTWDLVKLPKGNKTVYKKKEGIPGVEDERFKACLVAKGFSQKKGIEYNEIFSPVVKYSSIRVLLALVALYNLELEQLDVKTAFLHGELEETIYMSQPEGFAVEGKEDHVCKLKRSLYGLKQSSRLWYKRFDSFMLNHGYSRSAYDSCVYYRRLHDGSFIYLLLYVDDMLIAAKNLSQVQELKKQLSTEFDMKDLGSAKKILGMKISRDRKCGKLYLSQKRYIKKVLERFGMSNAKPVNTPLAVHFKLSASLSPKTKEEEAEIVVGSLMYAMVCTRPDIAQAVSVVSSTGCSVVGYVDSDYAGDLDKRRSLTGYVFILGGSAGSWRATLQDTVALSTTEAEYMATAEATKEALWLNRLVEELGVKQEESSVIFCDNQSAVQLTKNTMYHERTKHIDIRFHFVRNEVAKGTIKVKKVPTAENPADMLTKPNVGGLRLIYLTCDLQEKLEDNLSLSYSRATGLASLLLPGSSISAMVLAFYVLDRQWSWDPRSTNARSGQSACVGSKSNNTSSDSILREEDGRNKGRNLYTDRQHPLEISSAGAGRLEITEKS
ncbi:Retrovirus-related Pol polyprotein from transposon TNT 1-94-like protein [Drosera capensis]